MYLYYQFYLTLLILLEVGIVLGWDGLLGVVGGKNLFPYGPSALIKSISGYNPNLYT